MNLKEKFIKILRWSEKYTNTDMIYLVKGSFWWILSRVILLLLSLIIMMAFALWLPKEIFGAYQYILSMVAILAIFSLPGIDTTLVRTVAKGYEKVFLLCAKTKFRWALISSVGCFIVASWYFLHQNFVLGISFFIAGIFFPFINVFNLFTSFWHGKKRFDIQGRYQILLHFLSILVLLPIIFFFDNLILIIFALAISSTIFGGLFFQLTLKKIKNQETNKEQERETISYGKHLTLISSFSHFSAHIDKIIIWQLLGPISVAIYSFAQLPLQRIQEIVPIIPLAFPKLSEKNIKEIKKEIFRKFLKLFLFSVPLTILVILLAPYLYKIFFPVYLESLPYFQLLALSLFFIPFSLLGISLLTEMKKKALYIISFSAPLLQFVLFLVLIPLFQLWGAIFATLIAQFFGAILIFYFFRKI
jgi:O-antigen/teichoic acid export membrane protein